MYYLLSSWININTPFFSPVTWLISAARSWGTWMWYDIKFWWLFFSSVFSNFHKRERGTPHPSIYGWTTKQFFSSITKVHIFTTDRWWHFLPQILGYHLLTILKWWSDFLRWNFTFRDMAFSLSERPVDHINLKKSSPFFSWDDVTVTCEINLIPPKQCSTIIVEF